MTKKRQPLQDKLWPQARVAFRESVPARHREASAEADGSPDSLKESLSAHPASQVSSASGWWRNPFGYQEG